MSEGINVDKLTSTLAKQLLLYQDLVEEEVIIVQSQVAKTTKEKVKEFGTFKGSGSYRKGISTTPPKRKERHISCYVWGGYKNYPLTHLLENGHALVRGGRTVGHTQGFPHFEPAERWLEQNYVKELKKGIEKL